MRGTGPWRPGDVLAALAGDRVLLGLLVRDPAGLFVLAATVPVVEPTIVGVAEFLLRPI